MLTQHQAKGGEGESGAKDNSRVPYAAFDVFHFLEADMFLSWHISSVQSLSHI